MHFYDVKDNLRDARVLTVIACSLYVPTEEKLARLAAEYESDADIHAFACGVDIVRGVIILKRLSGDQFEILNIATDPAHRGRGLGSKLVSFAADALKCGSISAETDGEAVGFYRKCGFAIESLGEKYPGTVRYLCTRKWPLPGMRGSVVDGKETS